MKIDKDFVLKYGNHTFKAEEIETIKISNGWISMETIEKDGMVTRLNTKLKDVEFLSSTKAPAVETRTWAIWDGEEVVTRNMHGKEIRETVPDYRKYEMCGDCGFYAPPKGSRADDVEVVTPLEKVNKAFSDGVKVLDRVGKAAETLNKAMKVELLIDGKQFAKLMKECNKEQGRWSGGD